MSDRNASPRLRSLAAPFLLGVLGLAAGLTFGCSVLRTPSPGDPRSFGTPGVRSLEGPDAVREVSQLWARSWSAKDLEGTLALYADDAVFLPSIGGRVVGRAAIRTLFAQALAVTMPTLRLTSKESGLSDELAFDSGEYEETLVSQDGSREIRGSYLVVLRRDGRGAWRIVQHMWTDVRPAG